MKQFEYLNELKQNLEGKLSAEMIEDILSDYESFFVSGREEGKTDDEISNDLGSPAFLAKSLLEAQEEKQTVPVDKHIANPGRRLCAYFIDAVIASLPASILACTLRNAIVPFMLLITYPFPSIAFSISTSTAAFSIYRAAEYTVVGANSGLVLNSSEQRLIFTFAVLSMAFYIFYSLSTSLLFEGQTVEKKFMHIKVCHSDTSQATAGYIFSREFLGKVLINSIPFLPIILIFTILFTKEHKALHDMLADTIVAEV